MNPFLAELYNTAENIGTTDDGGAEKLAQAAVLDQMLANEGFSIDDLDPQDVVKVAAEVFGANSPLVKQAAEEGKSADDDDEEEAKEKMAEADFLGRQMAHAYVSELSELEKQAGLKETAGRAASWVGRKAGKAGKAAGKGLESLGEKATGTLLRTGGAEKMLNPRTKKAIGAGVIGTGAAALGGGGYAASKMGKKKESALDILAEQRALEMLKEAGLVENQNEKLAGAVNQRALEMLAEAGYDVG